MRRWTKGEGPDLLGRRFLRAAGISALLLSGTPALLLLLGLIQLDGGPFVFTPARLALWSLSMAVFAAAFWHSTATPADARHRRRAQVLLLVQTVAALLMFSVVCTGLETILLMVVAAQLGLFVRLPYGVLWMLGQLALLFGLGVSHTGWVLSIAWTLFSLPFAALALLVSYYAASEARARQELQRANAELRATQRILAESAQMAERERISRELHDVVGHHLAALHLNLEAARHQTAGASRERIEKCQSLAKGLLGDVRDVVRTLRDHGSLDLARVLKPLFEDVPKPRIHLQVSREIELDDPKHVHTLVRCVQEIITNAMKHSGAENLWIELHRGIGELEIRAYDDGRGAAAFCAGHGLKGMRARLEEIGGELHLPSPLESDLAAGSPAASALADGGFSLSARIPLSSP